MQIALGIMFLLCHLCLISSANAQLSTTKNHDFIVTFVGTGGPEINTAREGIATIVSVGDQKMLFDVGRNTMQNLYEAGINPIEVTDIFITHLHNDHIEGLPTLWMTGWFLLGRTEPLRVWGPKGTQDMINGMYQMYQFDIEQRSNRFNDKAHLDIIVSEISEPQVVIQETEVIVSAITAQHDDGDPAFGYTVEHQNHKVLMTGDGRLFKELQDASKGVDVLISNILSMPEALAKKPEMQGVVAKLMSVPEAATLFNKAKPGLAVYSHFVGKELPKDSDGFIEEQTRKAGYLGPLFLAKDGWSVNVKTLEVSSPPPKASLPNLDRKASYSN
ncbi:MBL fold metallo-hydrolase [Paraglaciecola sp. 2405UD69-4]|uniref:MBL fold metallo-hydrolase n=1 Tax=Paraglaciecola sp. 2405UD69-4 TaxID=3391836 RepID=UPI0039C90410